MTAGQTFLLQAFPASSRKALGVRQLCCPLSCLVSALAIKSVVAFLRGVSGKYIWHKHSAFQRSRVSSGCSVFVWFCFLNTFRKMEVQILSHPKCGTCSMVQWFVTNQLGAEHSRANSQKNPSHICIQSLFQPYFCNTKGHLMFQHQAFNKWRRFH